MGQADQGIGREDGSTLTRYARIGPGQVTEDGNMQLSLKGKVAAVTGGSEGIGRAAALRLAELGAKVAICARRAEVLEKTAGDIRKLGAEVLSMTADATSAGDMARFVGETVQRFGRIDVLVNNAGATGQAAFDKVDDAAWQQDLEIKVMAHVRTSREVIPHMKRQGGGRIINLNMVAARQPGANQFPTTVSRAAGLALTKGLSKELVPFKTACARASLSGGFLQGGFDKLGAQVRRERLDEVKYERTQITVGTQCDK